MDPDLSNDWYVASIDRVDHAADAACEALHHTVAVLRQAREDRLAGVPLTTIVDRLVQGGGRGTRRAVDETFREYSEAVTAYRAAGIRALVDEEGMSLTEVARLIGVSRQMVGRLYRSASTNLGQ